MIDRVTDFTWALNPEWWDKITKQQLRGFFEEYKDTTIVWKNDGQVEGVGVYMEVNGTITFILFDCVGEGYTMMREFLRVNKHNSISWLNRSLEIIKCRH